MKNISWKLWDIFRYQTNAYTYGECNAFVCNNYTVRYYNTQML